MPEQGTKSGQSPQNQSYTVVYGATQRVEMIDAYRVPGGQSRGHWPIGVLLQYKKMNSSVICLFTS